jgi:hypothetical protein
VAAEHGHVVFFFIARVDDQEGGGHLHGEFLARRAFEGYKSQFCQPSSLCAAPAWPESQNSAFYIIGRMNFSLASWFGL